MCSNLSHRVCEEEQMLSRGLRMLTPKRVLEMFPIDIFTSANTEIFNRNCLHDGLACFCCIFADIDS